MQRSVLLPVIHHCQAEAGRCGEGKRRGRTGRSRSCGLSSRAAVAAISQPVTRRHCGTAEPRSALLSAVMLSRGRPPRAGRAPVHSSPNATSSLRARRCAELRPLCKQALDVTASPPSPVLWRSQRGQRVLLLPPHLLLPLFSLTRQSRRHSVHAPAGDPGPAAPVS